MRHRCVFLLLGLLLVLLARPEMAWAGDFSGTWRGLLQAEGEAAETEVLFSQDGYPVYTYTNNRGLTRQVELRTHGQEIEYVPAGGGVQRIVVERIEQRPDILTISLKGSFEKAGSGYMDQQQEVVLFEYQLIPEGLKLRIRRQAISHFGDKDMIVGGQPPEASAEGLLQRVK